MNINNLELLAEKFIQHSPDFYSDMSISDVDKKHQGIVFSAYQEAKKNKNSWGSFRNWSGQSDGLSPVYLSFDLCKKNGYLKTLIRFFYVKLFKSSEDKCFRSTLEDDLQIMKQIGADRLLAENPASGTLGANSYCMIEGFAINQRWARYIYLLKRILDLNLISNDEIWVDIGSFYGGLQGLVKKYNPDVKIVMVDFHHQLCRSYIYLCSLYPDATHILPNQLNDFINLENLPKGAIVYVPVSSYDKIQSARVQLTSNFFSFGEMRRQHFLNYMNSELFTKAKKTYLVNRFVSAPFFEKTYDSDLNVFDYISDQKIVEYFDIFPMHHYQLIKRNILGGNFFRNTSSSYFELIAQSKK
jgi:putative sugar O-methyltransferase